MLILVSSCQSGLASVNNYCEIAKPLYFTKEVVDAMSDEETYEWLTHNEIYQEICNNLKI
jgi:capsular polysaccharide biosynthesis protein